MSIMEKTLRETVADYEVRIPMSYQEYHQSFDEDVHVEWVNGEAVIFMSAATRHQIIVAYLFHLLRNYIEFHRLGTLLSAPYEMKVSPNSNAREPDLLFIKTENKHYLEEQRLAGAADLVVEVVSPESVKRDNEEKFAEYEAAGVQEYWIIDPRPEQQRAEFWVLDENGQYRSMPVHEHIYHSTVLSGFWLNTEWLWDTERYSALAAFAEIAGLPQDVVALLQRGAQ
ncbi:MAG TPA: Uma2 family endonuclease [Caldilineaceae bacterium]|nr:Uma2 family endonuclease [Caldilineaceae bacterium]